MIPHAVRRLLHILLVSLAISVSGSILLYIGIIVFSKPSNDRVWLPEQAELASVEMTNDLVTIHNVRDWEYEGNAITSNEWTDVSVNPTEVTRVWFLIEPFHISAIGHTFLSFEFSDGTTLAFSVEARREADEAYSALKGLGPTYELAYQWGTERDFITRRTNYLGHPVRMYPLSLPPGGGTALFNSLIAETNSIAEKPRFYNTLFANCTNVLAHMVNKHYPDTLPYDISWTLTGLSDEYLMREGFIAKAATMEDTKSTYDLTPHQNDIRSHAHDTPLEFSFFVRSLLSASNTEN